VFASRLKVTGGTHSSTFSESDPDTNVRKMSATPPLVAGRSLVYAFSISRDFQSGFRSNHAAPLVIFSIASTRAWTPPMSFETTARTPAACAKVQSSSDANMVNRISPHCGMEAEMSRAASKPFILGIA
jgi:hypothetical protein